MGTSRRDRPARAFRWREPVGVTWLAVPGDEVLARLPTGSEGLSTVDAQRRLAEHGPNVLARQRGPSAWPVLLRQFTSPLI